MNDQQCQRPKVRFAPSPTGNLHVGGARTALFNWAFSRAAGGTFVLRIEDTDAVRSSKEFEEDILDSLSWLGITWDEGPYYQSQRIAFYREHAEKLLSSGAAYLSEPSETGGRAVILKNIWAGEAITFEDAVHDPITIQADELKDQVLMKSDGMPAYNFACVVDDALMGITHVIRGDDHISNTPKQLMMYRALGFTPPVFAHVPMIHGEDGKKLSKRHGAVSVTEYRKLGILPEALFNFLLLLGWSPGNNVEKLSREEASRLFGIDRIVKKASLFSMDKLLWLNAGYIREADPGKLYDIAVQTYGEQAFKSFPRDYCVRFIAIFKDRYKTVAGLVEDPAYMFCDDYEITQQAIDAGAAAADKLEPILGHFAGIIEKQGVIDRVALEAAVREYAEQQKMKIAAVIHPLRAAVTGRTATPGLFEIMELLGPQKTAARIRGYLSRFSSKP